MGRSRDTNVLEARLAEWFRNPHLLYQKPFEVADKVYFVGNNWVSAFLLDSDAGLVLIDCAIQETLYQMIDSFYQLGFDPHKLKKILLTHGHFDHCGAAGSLQKLSGCEVWIGEGDANYFTEHRERIAHEDRCPDFELTGCYDYSKPIDRHVDIVLPSHAGHTTDYDFFGIAEGKPGAGDSFVDPTAWRRMLTAKRAEIIELIEKSKQN